jgi:hypothetical protein
MNSRKRKSLIYKCGRAALGQKSASTMPRTNAMRDDIRIAGDDAEHCFPDFLSAYENILIQTSREEYDAYFMSIASKCNSGPRDED